MAITKEELADIRERVDKASDFKYTPQGIMCEIETLRFLGYAKKDVPKLDEIERLQKIEAKAKEVIKVM